MRTGNTAVLAWCARRPLRAGVLPAIPLRRHLTAIGRRDDQRLHLRHRLLEADEQRMGDDGVADVQLVDPGDRRHRLGVVVVQAMAGVDDQAVL